MNILDALTQGPILGDGGFGSELIKRGLQAGDVPELWNADHPDRVKDAHTAYIEAGSRLVLTNTFGGNRIKLTTAGAGERMAELNRAAVALLKDGCPDNVFIGGDMGPTGDFLEPIGTGTEADFIAAFSAQAQVLADAGVDILVLETMMDLNEIVTAVKGAREACDLPVVASMTFEQGASGDYRTMTGVDVPRFVEACESLAVDVIGTNCGKGIHETLEVLRLIKAETGRFTLAFPNAGVPVVKNGETVYEQTPEVMKPYYRQLVDLGVSIIGGCCGTTPEHIKMVSTLL